MTRYSALLLTCVLALASACGDDPAGPDGDGSLTATVNSAQFSSGEPPTAWIMDGELAIAAIQGSGSEYKSISIQITGVTHTGTYALGPDDNFAAYSEGGLGDDFRLWFTNSEATGNQVVITELTGTRVSGTFNFVAEPFLNATGTITVTNGSFSVKLLPLTP